ncbi:helix-turn-helix transcriptional regulator [Reinekea thalattae]|uniref:Helix-turn-helix transcriptional regulator n=1 Tax=Reinekea thalattae TaxID=2593301 RepID=A0A5C8Z524_9GAMM|nr:helix-turn-helix transcriptional regulator [Reinekea thalattae]TXR52020.1 helix-turn-helix transcriptional regulator [Reinekea thalattae]
MSTLLEQIKKRRLQLAMKQHDMMLRVGMSRQQYQRLESKGNPRLDTLELIAKGLNSELVLVPEEKLKEVLAVLADEVEPQGATEKDLEAKTLADDPWQGLLGADE